MNDPRPSPPIANPIALGSRRKKIINLAMLIFGILDISHIAMLGDDQMVAMDRSWDGSFGETGADKLQQRHRCRCIVACCAVWIQLEEAFERFDILGFRLA